MASSLTTDYQQGSSKQIETEDLEQRMREEFMVNVTKLFQSKGNNTKIFPKDKYMQLIHEVKEAKAKCKKEPIDYRRLARFDVIREEGREKLIEQRHPGQTKIRYFLYMEELFDVIRGIHVNTKHGGRTRMVKELQSKYKNITKEVITIYLTLCGSCLNKNNTAAKKPQEPKSPDASSTQQTQTQLLLFNSRGQVDILNMESQQDGEYKHIMIYQDVLTKFVFLRPLKKENHKEVAQILLDIFTIIGAPCILQSENGRDFPKYVVKELNDLWEELKMVHGRPPHRSHQCQKEGINMEIQTLVRTWMQSNNSTRWAGALRFLQFMKNRTLHNDIRRTPFQAMFGCKGNLGLSNSILSKERLWNIKSEEDLVEAEKELRKNQYATRTVSTSEQYLYCEVCEKRYTPAQACVLCKMCAHVISGFQEEDNEEPTLENRVTCSRCDEENSFKREIEENYLKIEVEDNYFQREIEDHDTQPPLKIPKQEDFNID